MLWFSLFVIHCGIVAHVETWGGDGHRIIARLAQSQLRDRTADWVRSLVPWHWTGNMSAMASWADDILYPNSNPTGFDNWQWSRSLHYINTPDWSCDYRAERDCLNDICTAGAIRNYTRRLETALDPIQHQEALYFLIHYVGDIHQPLHTGFQSDHGGNSVRGRFMNNTGQVSLHSLWDTGIINYRMKRDFSSDVNRYYDYIYDLMMRQSISNSDDNDIQQWIEENLHFICRQIYFDDHDKLLNSSTKFNLNEIYYQRNYPIIEQRLVQGGRRLGALLNRLGENPPRKTEPYLRIYILIAVLFGEFSVGIILGIVFCIRYEIQHSRETHP